MIVLLFITYAESMDFLRDTSLWDWDFGISSRVLLMCMMPLFVCKSKPLDPATLRKKDEVIENIFMSLIYYENILLGLYLQ